MKKSIIKPFEEINVTTYIRNTAVPVKRRYYSDMRRGILVDGSFDDTHQHSEVFSVLQISETN
jgi:hypothetical protein